MALDSQNSGMFYAGFFSRAVGGLVTVPSDLHQLKGGAKSFPGGHVVPEGVGCACWWSHLWNPFLSCDTFLFCFHATVFHHCWSCDLRNMSLGHIVVKYWQWVPSEISCIWLIASFGITNKLSKLWFLYYNVQVECWWFCKAVVYVT